MKSEKRLWNRQKYFKINKNVSEARKSLLQELRKDLQNWLFFYHISVQSYCVGTFCYCQVMFSQNVTQIGNEYNFVYILIYCSICGHKTKSELTDSVPLQLQDSICAKDIIQNYKIIQNQAGYWYEVVVMFVRLYHNINVSKRTLKRRLSYCGF